MIEPPRKSSEPLTETVNPKPLTLNPKPLNPKPLTLKAALSALGATLPEAAWVYMEACQDKGLGFRVWHQKYEALSRPSNVMPFW